MDIQNINIDNARLVEGKVYPFRVVKTVSMGPEDDWYVLQDPLGYKILLSKSLYTHYGIEPGMEINCRVDKINCNGKIFLEPEHPIYKEKEVYTFTVVCTGHRKDILDCDEHYFMVRDAHHLEWKVKTFSKKLWDNPPEEISCYVSKIKKGRLYLKVAGEIPDRHGLQTGQSYLFTIAGEKTDKEKNTAYFILEDGNGYNHILKKKHYLHYGFKKGDQIMCTVDAIATEGFLMLEPLHPCYEAGKRYEFPVDRLERMIFNDGFTQKVLVLKDCFGKDVRVFTDDRLASLLGQNRLVIASVKRIRKGMPELEISDQQLI
ncbi:MAG: hypothetical protein RG741_08420 [Bacteroidales bacterium]|nr:hypothetical protein [Bacteroidales bacterium]